LDKLTQFKKISSQAFWDNNDFAPHLSELLEVSAVEKLPGDASTRAYYRISYKDRSTRILMKTDPFDSSEFGYPFLQVQRHLKKHEIRVPVVYDVAPREGLILLEDLGDITLLRRLESVKNKEEEYKIYAQIIDQLYLMHTQASAPDTTVAAFSLYFDFSKLFWEVEFTIKNLYLKYLKKEFKKTDLEIIKEGFSKICKTIANEKVVFTHRDFHSRNVMVLKDKEYVIIDFQDARMGPPQYDLVSLLKDCYYQLSEENVQKLLDKYWLLKKESEKLSEKDKAHFEYIFDLMTLQRSFKAIGSFAFFYVDRGDSRYLKFIGNTFETIRRVLLKYPEFNSLREALFHYYYF